MPHGIVTRLRRTFGEPKVQIPVKLFTAESRDEEIHFRQLDKDHLAPIKYERVSSKTGRPVAWKDIVKGFE